MVAIVSDFADIRLKIRHRSPLLLDGEGMLSGGDVMPGLEVRLGEVLGM